MRVAILPPVVLLGAVLLSLDPSSVALTSVLTSGTCCFEHPKLSR